MAPLVVGINGFGRIGRMVTRRLLERTDVVIPVINDLTDAATLAHLFRYDSVHGRWPEQVYAEDGHLVVGPRRIRVVAEKDAAQLPWAQHGVQVVLESTGKYTDGAKARLHLQAGAQKVVISAPATGDVDATLVRGVNDQILTPAMQVVSNASCTTNCLAPMVKVLDDAFGLVQGYMTTVHAYTADQNLQDAPHKDLRRARAAALNIVPTTTGAAKAVGLVLPHLKGKLDGIATRVPVPDGSLTDLTAVLSRAATAQEVNAAMQAACEGTLHGIMHYSEDPLVSTDIVGDPHSCIFDALCTSSMGTLVKIVGWYDNEAGYAARTAELVLQIGKLV